MNRLQALRGLTACFVVLLFVPALAAQDKEMKFELFKDAKEEFRWRLKGADGAILATGGQGYKAKADAQRGIEILQEAGADKAKTRFEVYEDAKKAFRWRLVASNGNVVAGSTASYQTKADAEKAIELVKKAGKAPVEDLTKK